MVEKSQLRWISPSTAIKKEMKLTIPQIQQRIAEALPVGRVVPRHTAEGHFYEIVEDNNTGIVVPHGTKPPYCVDNHGPIYPSVTGKLQILKDKSLINYKMNRAIDYVFTHYKEFTDTNVMEQLDRASRASQDILEDAGDIGTQIHDTRERIFSQWLDGRLVTSFIEYIDPANPDPRLVSTMRALQKFVTDYNYVPIATELLVYSHKLKVAGTLDDIGMMDKVVRAGTASCEHDMVGTHCMKCDRKVKRIFVLMDLKSSNNLRDHYWLQLAMYYEMFRKLTGLKPEMVFILKLSKTDGTYQIEELRNIGKIIGYAKHVLKTNEGLEFIRKNRKDNQKKVAEKIDLS